MQISDEEREEIVVAYKQDAQDQLTAYFRGERRIDDADYLYHLQRVAAGCCSTCEYLSPIKSVELLENGQRITFECGHSDIAQAFKENVGIKESFRVAAVGIQANEEGVPLQRVSAAADGFSISREEAEKLVVIRLCKKAKSHLVQFSNEIQDSAVDVIAINGSQSEFFQVTKLYEERFWEKLAVNRHTDFITRSVVELVKEAVERKLRYDAKEIAKMILAIDIWPGISGEYVNQICEQNHLFFAQSGYKEIWLVGETDEMIYKIF